MRIGTRLSTSVFISVGAKGEPGNEATLLIYISWLHTCSFVIYMYQCMEGVCSLVLVKRESLL